MNLNLGLDWRRGYSAMAGLQSNFTHLPMQLLSGDQDSNTLYINQPTVGVAGPNLSYNAVEFNHGTAIQRAVSKAQQFFTVTPTAFHTRTLFYLESLAETVIWALVPAKSMSDVTLQFRLRLGYESNQWWFIFENLGANAANPAQIWAVYSYFDYPITAPLWYQIITSAPYTVNSNYGNLYVNDERGGSSGTAFNGYTAQTYGSPTQNLALFFSVADDDLYDGILGQTEGARRLVGRVSDFAYSFEDISSLDYDPSYPKEFSYAMVLKLCETAFSQSSPFEYGIPLKRPVRSRLGNSLAKRAGMGFRGTF